MCLCICVSNRRDAGPVHTQAQCCMHFPNVDQRLVEFLRLEVCLEDTTLVEAGDIGSEMYFIHKGLCAVLGRGDAGVIRTYVEGDCFGAAPLLVPELRATNSVKVSIGFGGSR